MPDEGVTVNQPLAEKLGLKPGTKFSLYNDSLEERDVKVDSVRESFLATRVCMTDTEYEEVFGEKMTPNTVYVHFGEVDSDSLMKKLTDVNAEYAKYITLSTVQDTMQVAGSASKIFNMVAYIVIGLAAVLNLMIMINLTNIMVNHRMKDVLVMRVNGFTMKQVKRYLMRETLVTTGFGIGCGLIIGIPITFLFLKLIGNLNYTFKMGVSYMAWIVAVGLTIVFTLITNLISFRNIKNKPLTDVTKY